MKWWLETTQWRDNTPNGVYLLNDSKNKMYAFRSFGGQGQLKIFKRPLRIDTRGRRFELSSTQWKITVEAEVPAGRVWEVTGSKGDIYRVSETEHGLSCTCTGFKFRGDCKHIREVQ